MLPMLLVKLDPHQKRIEKGVCLFFSFASLSFDVKQCTLHFLFSLFVSVWGFNIWFIPKSFSFHCNRTVDARFDLISYLILLIS